MIFDSGATFDPQRSASGPVRLALLVEGSMVDHGPLGTAGCCTSLPYSSATSSGTDRIGTSTLSGLGEGNDLGQPLPETAGLQLLTPTAAKERAHGGPPWLVGFSLLGQVSGP